MPTTIPLDEAQANLKALIDRLQPGEELIITNNQQAVARLIGQAPESVRPAPGLGKGQILYMDPNFNDPLDDWAEEAG